MKRGLSHGLTNYGDRDFALYLRRSFARSMGLSDRLLDAPIVGIAAAPSGFNNCHRNIDELAEAVPPGLLPGGGLPPGVPAIFLVCVSAHPPSTNIPHLL